MKWLLLSNYNNPGDEWARFGVERIIASIDNSAELFHVEKDTGESIHTRIDYDISVMCGQPLVWSNPYEKDGKRIESSTRTVRWWSDANGWMSEDRKMIVSGYGTFLFYNSFPDSVHIENRDEVIVSIKALFDRCRLTYARTDLVKKFLGEDTLCLPCPSVFASEFPPTHELKLCNFMPHGGHYPHCKHDDAGIWDVHERAVSDLLFKTGFMFIAHSAFELNHAIFDLGWPEYRCIRFGFDSMEHLKVYSRCKRYFGNRIHGAIVSRSFGAEVLCCGYDSRLEAVRMVGGDVMIPSMLSSMLDMGILEAWANKDSAGEPFDQEAAFKRQKELIECAI